MKKQLTKSQKEVLNAMQRTGGRFFGLYTTQGESINAQFEGATDQYVTIYDRNNFRSRRLAKTSLSGLRVASRNVGRVF